MPKWTPAQQNAIDARGGTVLVCAAAGSGKTAVLVERVIQLLLEEAQPVDVNRLLIVTFTNAAAAEMRERISKALSAQILLQPGNQHLLRQQMLLPGAKICTIDAFCKDLVQENFYRLPIAQDFRILDESERTVMEEEAAAAVLERLYQEESPAFLSLVELLSSSRNDDALNYYIMKLHDYVMAHPFPNQWLDRMVGMYAENIPLDKSIWAALIQAHTRSALSYLCRQLERCDALLACDAVLSDKIRPVIANDLFQINALLRTDGWDQTINAFDQLTFQRFPTIKGYADHPEKNHVMAVRKEIKKTMESLRALYCATVQEHKEDMVRLAPIVAVLAEAVKQFHQTLAQRKQGENALSFADIEHYALKLLVAEKGDTFERTELALELRHQYDQILIDEYQDTNRAQDMLFQALSNDDNLFMVGDVKQSIYRFRQAMPQIFTEKKESFARYDGRSFPAQIVLDQNFRSREQVCKFINFIFETLFSKEVGELTYSSEEALHCGAGYPDSAEPSVGVHILNAPGLSAKDSDTYEAEYLARLIRDKIKAGTLVSDKAGGQRRAEYGDFAVLFRSASAHIPNYIKVFKQYGIPVSSEAGSAFFETPEIVTMLSLLRVLDNPMQDIPLLSVMMSPLFGFTPDELGLMKIEDRKSALYTCVSHYAKTGDVKTQRFFETLNRLRTYSVTMPAGSFVRKVFGETSYVAIAKSMGEPRQREANLNLLLEYADYFEQSGKKGLSAFIRFIDKVSESGQKLGGANVRSGNQKAVSLMSIHRSKGLEFPICILAGNSRKYNNASIRENLLLHPELGAGLKVHNEALLYQYASVPYNAVRLAIKNAEMSENLRVLYVAMTRAREQLILLMTENHLERRLVKLAGAVSSGALSSYLVGNMASDGELLLSCVLLHKDAELLRQLAGTDVRLKPSGFPLDVRIVKELEEAAQEVGLVSAVPADPQLVQKIKEKLTFHYPFTQLANVAAKRNASSLDEKKADQTYFAVSRPAFLSSDGLTSAQKGTAMHAFMQHCDYQAAKSDVNAEAERMLSKGFLNERERQVLAQEKLAGFFHSSFAERIFRADKVMREIKFAAFVNAAEIYPELKQSEEQIYIQGIADCVFIENGSMVVVDYKTDRVKEEDELLSRYRNQLRFYCTALENTYQMPVKECYLYSFYLDRPLQYDFI